MSENTKNLENWTGKIGKNTKNWKNPKNICKKIEKPTNFTYLPLK
jgi:hypothetical protein